jgi:hypothetical protein
LDLSRFLLHKPPITLLYFPYSGCVQTVMEALREGIVLYVTIQLESTNFHRHCDVFSDIQ